MAKKEKNMESELIKPDVSPRNTSEELTEKPIIVAKKEEVKPKESPEKKEISMITASEYCAKRNLPMMLATGINQVEKIKDKTIEDWDKVFNKFMKWDGKTEWETFKKS